MFHVTAAAKFSTHAKIKYTKLYLTDLISFGLMCVKKIHQFLSSTKQDVHKRKMVPFFLPHGVYLL